MHAGQADVPGDLQAQGGQAGQLAVPPVGSPGLTFPAPRTRPGAAPPRAGAPPPPPAPAPCRPPRAPWTRAGLQRTQHAPRHRHVMPASCAAPTREAAAPPARGPGAPSSSASRRVLSSCGVSAERASSSRAAGRSNSSGSTHAARCLRAVTRSMWGAVAPLRSHAPHERGWAPGGVPPLSMRSAMPCEWRRVQPS